LTTTRTKNPDSSVESFLDGLRRGDILLLPVDTLLGLGVRADLQNAVERLYVLKGRPATKAFALAFSNVDQLIDWTLPSPAHIRGIKRLVESGYLPGPLTLILPGSSRLAALRQEWGVSVACRLPGSSPSSSLLAQCPWPLALTSANFSGQGNPESQALLDAELLRSVDLVFPGDPPLAEASTLLSLLQNPPIVLRPGALKGSALATLIEVLQ
jgi:L-threonylcarbamoyladenylate synthase